MKKLHKLSPFSNMWKYLNRSGAAEKLLFLRSRCSAKRKAKIIFSSSGKILFAFRFSPLLRVNYTINLGDMGI